MNNTVFSKEWEKLDKQTAFYWQLLQVLPEDTLRDQPAPEKWSILQVMEHLAGAESAGLQYLLKKNYTPLKSRSLMPAPLRSFLLKLSLRSPLKFKAPKVEGLMPHNNTPANELLQGWQEQRRKLALYLEQAPAHVNHEPLFRHPFAGALSLGQMLQFMREHLDHHQRQVEAILAQKV